MNVAVTGGVVRIGGASGPDTRRVTPARSWADDAIDAVRGTGLIVLAAGVVTVGLLAIERFLGER